MIVGSGEREREREACVGYCLYCICFHVANDDDDDHYDNDGDDGDDDDDNDGGNLSLLRRIRVALPSCYLSLQQPQKQCATHDDEEEEEGDEEGDDDDDQNEGGGGWGGGDDDDDDDDGDDGGDDDDISTGRVSSRLDKILPRAKLGAASSHVFKTAESKPASPESRY